MMLNLYLNHFDTHIETFDPTHLTFAVPDITVNGLSGSIKQTKPLEVTTVINNPQPAVANEEPEFIKFSNNLMLFKDINVLYSNSVTAMETKIGFKDLTIHPEVVRHEKLGSSNKRH